MPGLPELLTTLTEARFGARGQRALSRATADSPSGVVDSATISRIISGQNRNPGHETLSSLAWALGETEDERAEVLEQLRLAAGLTAQAPPQLRWPKAVEKLSAGQVRQVQRAVNMIVALAAGEPEGSEDAPLVYEGSVVIEEGGRGAAEPHKDTLGAEDPKAMNGTPKV